MSEMYQQELSKFNKPFRQVQEPSRLFWNVVEGLELYLPSVFGRTGKNIFEIYVPVKSLTFC